MWLHHFEEEYNTLVNNLMKEYSIEDAISRAAGGTDDSFEVIGDIESAIMLYAGLLDGMTLLDFGCGGGRLAASINKKVSIRYRGIDIVQVLLEYAKKKSPASYQFTNSSELSLPFADESIDMFAAFSVFTHLLHSETFIYLKECRRVLSRGGKAVISFVEFENDQHWDVFDGEVKNRKSGGNAPLNTMIERNVICLWSKKLDFRNLEFIDGCDAPWTGSPLWQTVAIMQKP